MLRQEARPDVSELPAQRDATISQKRTVFLQHKKPTNLHYLALAVCRGPSLPLLPVYVG